MRLEWKFDFMNLLAGPASVHIQWEWKVKIRVSDLSVEWNTSIFPYSMRMKKVKIRVSDTDLLSVHCCVCPDVPPLHNIITFDFKPDLLCHSHSCVWVTDDDDVTDVTNSHHVWNQQDKHYWQYFAISGKTNSVKEGPNAGLPCWKEHGGTVNL